MRFDLSTIRSQLAFLLIEISLIGAIVLYGYCTGAVTTKVSYAPMSYEQLGEAFLSGHTYLNIPPSHELLALPDPYDPIANANVPVLWDASLYKGHYYLYFGPVPALLWVPVKWLTGFSLDDEQIAFLFCTIGTYALVWLLGIIARQQPPALQWGLLFVVMSACFGTWIPQMLHQGGIYAAPVCGAYCFTMLGLIALWHGNSPRGKLLGSLCLGLAVGCRMPHALNAIILFAVWLSNIRRGQSWRTFIRETLYLGIPWSLCIAALAAYNYARFGSVFETGVRYQINNLENVHAHYWQFANIAPNFYEYFLKPFPLATWLHWQPDFGTRHGWDIVHGLWLASPFSLWSLWFLCNIRSSKSWLGNAYGLAIGVTLFTLAMTLFVLLFRYHMNRYMVDFAPWLMALAALGYMHALQTCAKRRQPALLAAGGITALCSAYIGIVAAAPWWM